MSAHFVPPRDPNTAQINQIRDKIAAVLNQYISGRGKETKVTKAVDELIKTLRPLLKIAPPASKGATVMTEAATRNEYNNFTKGPNNL